MLTHLTRSLLCAVLAFSTSSCPANPQTDQKVAEGQKKVEDALEKTGEQAKQFGEEMRETTEQAGETIKEGYANFTAEVKEKYPQVVESMQKNFDALKQSTVEAYEKTLAPDAPRHAELIAEFRKQAPLRKTYALETFTVESASETEAVAVVVLASRNSDPTQPAEDKHASFRYTFRKAADSEEWLVYDVVPLDEGAKAVTGADAAKDAEETVPEPTNP